jgi:hypothetical protein
VQNLTTDFLNSTSAAALATQANSLNSSTIRPTPSERAAGRLMRAPDHDAGGDDTILSGASAGEGDGDGGSAGEAGEGEGDKDGGEGGGDGAGDDAGAGGDGDGSGDGDGDKAGEQNEFLGAPEGDYEITGLPEGVEIDKTALEALAPVAKEMDLSSAAMSKLAGVYAEQILPHVTETIAKEIEGQAAALRKEWDGQARLEISGGKDADGKTIEPLKDAKGEPVYGGKSFDEVVQVAAKAIDRFGGDDLRQALRESGFGSHPAMVKAFFLAGTKLKEDTFERGGPGASPKTDAEVFYGTNAG